MSGLVLKLKPTERLLINGALLENGTRRGSICVLSESAKVLRLRDIVHPDDANTPIRRVCCLIQLLFTQGVEDKLLRARIKDQLIDLKHVFLNTPAEAVIERVLQNVDAEENDYASLKFM